MTTNNHPAHGPVSLDRLHQIREILSKAAAQSDGGNLGYAMADAVKAIDELLSVRKMAAKEAVYQVLDDGSWTDYSKQQLEGLLESKPSTLFRVVYPSPSLTQPVLVDEDDNFYSWFGREWEKYYQPNNYSLSAKKHLGAIAESAWFACRAAMLQAGNSPVIGIDLASEPDRSVEVRYFAPPGYVMVPKELTCEMDDAAWQAYHETRSMSDIWAALLSAAPQQEVKS
ncbi:TPA: hypothetical protein L3G55_001676 [Citrobacter freundii]|nr:hypothetical protein [Citrobacter freundii]HBN5875183.1 hypothetical protein [Citrobacter freundii]HBU6121370.1 hypothetical protein [Citrobacter freundii]HBU8578987.1 hypothetical protein [Citrobacter freundii]